MRAPSNWSGTAVPWPGPAAGPDREQDLSVTATVISHPPPLARLGHRQRRRSVPPARPSARPSGSSTLHSLASTFTRTAMSRDLTSKENDSPRDAAYLRRIQTVVDIIRREHDPAVLDRQSRVKTEIMSNAKGDHSTVRLSTRVRLPPRSHIPSQPLMSSSCTQDAFPLLFPNRAHHIHLMNKNELASIQGLFPLSSASTPANVNANVNPARHVPPPAPPSPYSDDEGEATIRAASTRAPSVTPARHAFSPVPSSRSPPSPPAPISVIPRRARKVDLSLDECNMPYFSRPDSSRAARRAGFARMLGLAEDDPLVRSPSPQRQYSPPSLARSPSPMPDVSSS
jgi:hypothetical protein